MFFPLFIAFRVMFHRPDKPASSLWFNAALVALAGLLAMYPFAVAMVFVVGLRGCFRRKGELVLRRSEGEPVTLRFGNQHLDCITQPLSWAGIPTTHVTE